MDQHVGQADGQSLCHAVKGVDRRPEGRFREYEIGQQGQNAPIASQAFSLEKAASQRRIDRGMTAESRLISRDLVWGLASACLLIADGVGIEIRRHGGEEEDLHQPPACDAETFQMAVDGEDDLVRACASAAASPT